MIFTCTGCFSGGLFEHFLRCPHQRLNILVVSWRLDKVTHRDTSEVISSNFTGTDSALFCEDHLEWLFDEFTGEGEVR